jgi:hypothetical protein
LPSRVVLALVVFIQNDRDDRKMTFLSSIQTMDACDVLYGVTMEQPGICKLVSVELRGEKRPVPAAVEAAE